MADTTAVPTTSDVWDDGKRIHAIGTIAIGASPLTYPANGIPCDFVTAMVDGAGLGLPLPGISEQPLRVDIRGIAGFQYDYDRTNKKILVRPGLGAHSHDILLIGGITATEPVAVQGGDTLGKNAATNRTIAGANSATKGGVVAVAEGANGQVTTNAAIAAGISGDTIQFYAIWKKLQ